MIVLIEKEKILQKFQYWFYINNYKQTRNKRELAEPDKGHLQKPTACIILNGEKLQCFLTRTQGKQKMCVPTISVQPVLQVLASAIRHKWSKRYTERKGRSSIVENFRGSTKYTWINK